MTAEAAGHSAGDRTTTAEQVLDLVGRDPRDALRVADGIVDRVGRPRSPADVAEAATAHRAAGLAQRSLGDPVEAERRLRRGLAVAERGGRPDVAAEIRMSLAFVLLELGRNRAALAATDHALSVLTGLRAARVRVIRALVLERSGRTRESFAEYDAAWPVIHRAGDQSWEARLRHNRALLSMKTGDTASALADLDWTREFDLSEGHTTDAADALWNMGSALGLAGDIPGALELFDRADVEWAGVERPERWLGRAEVLLMAGLVDEAAAYARTAIAWLRERGWQSLEAEGHVNLALCLLSSPTPDLATARVHARTARSMFAKQDRPEWEYLAQYAEMKAVLLGGASARELDRTVKVASELRDRGSVAHAADLRVTAGRSALEAGDVTRARTLLGPLAATRSATQLDVRGRSWYARAMLAEIDGDTASADAALRHAWRAVETQRSLLGATELRAGAATHAAALVAAGARISVGAGSATSAFQWAELGRSAALRYQPAVAPRDPELASALTRLRWAARSEDEARLEGASAREESRSRARREAEVVRLTRSRGRDSAGLSPVGAREVASRLPTGTFVQFLAVGHELWAITVQRSRRRLIALGALERVEAALDTAVFGLRRLNTGFGTAAGRAAALTAVNRAAQVLDDALLAPLIRLVGDGDIVVCPTGALTAVPWSMLPSLRGRAVRVTPSATVWCRAQDRPPVGSAHVLAVAGPGLPSADAEVADVVRLHPGATRLGGQEASVARVLDEMADATVLHLAAHGRLRTDNPLFSTLELADGQLTGYDLESLVRVPDSVVLSACSSGAGHATVADETLGLAWTLMGLGTSTVVAPLLPVPDAATRDLMVALHRQLATGIGLADSLARAQQAVDPDDAVAVGVAGVFVAYGG